MDESGINGFEETDFEFEANISYIPDLMENPYRKMQSPFERIFP